MDASCKRERRIATAGHFGTIGFLIAAPDSCAHGDGSTANNSVSRGGLMLNRASRGTKIDGAHREVASRSSTPRGAVPLEVSKKSPRASAAGTVSGLGSEVAKAWTMACFCFAAIEVLSNIPRASSLLSSISGRKRRPRVRRWTPCGERYKYPRCQP
jgi:hypothetical protein